MPTRPASSLDGLQKNQIVPRRGKLPVEIYRVLLSRVVINAGASRFELVRDGMSERRLGHAKAQLVDDDRAWDFRCMIPSEEKEKSSNESNRNCSEDYRNR